jgi:hypothetical protein
MPLVRERAMNPGQNDERFEPNRELPFFRRDDFALPAYPIPEVHLRHLLESLAGESG